MRTISTEGMGEEVREGSEVNVHFEVSQPGDDGELYEIYRSSEHFPEGLRFIFGRSLYSEALERTVAFCRPGAVVDSLCTDPEMATDHTLGIAPRPLSDGARQKWARPAGPVGNAQGAMEPPPMMQPRPEDTPPPWAPPGHVTLFHVRLDSVKPGVVPMHQDSYERIDWVTQRKAWATELFKRGWYARAMRQYKKALLDLETPIEWLVEEHAVERNQLRLQLHLNVAACGIKLPVEKPYPTLSTPKHMWDPQQDAIAHCSRVLKVDQCNVKALYRRAIAHLLLPADRHINGLACALDDLQRAIQLEPQNAELKRELKRAKAMQRELDQRQAGMFTRMIGEGEAV